MNPAAASAPAGTPRSSVELERLLAEKTAQLEVAERELQAFAYSISHDLKAPLRGINGFCEALQEDDAEKLDEQGRARLNRVAAAARHMTDLLEDLLKLSRVGGAPMAREAVDLSALARSLLASLRAREPQRTVECAVAEGLVVRGDPQLLSVALAQLLGNAWKFTARTPAARIEVGATPQAAGREACFVRDNGAGFDIKYAAKLFTPFQRLHAASEFPGNGIGLALVKRVLDKHGGRAWAESRPGAGATFFFVLPP